MDKQRTAPARGALRGAVWGAFLFAAALLGAAGCRENPPLVPVQPAPPDRLQWHAGDRFVFNTWSIMVTGYLDTASYSLSVRKVLQTGASYRGSSGVVVMLDSIAVPGMARRLDTLYFYQAANGDLWQYGLLALVNSRYTGGSLPPQWNLLAGLSLGPNSVWTAGQADTLSNVTGSYSEEPNYFSALVNGSSSLYLTKRVELYGAGSSSGYTFGYTLWLSIAPPLFARIIEPSSPVVRGLYRELVAASVGQ